MLKKLKRFIAQIVAKDELHTLKYWELIHEDHLIKMKAHGLGGAAKCLENMAEYMRYYKGNPSAAPDLAEVLAENMVAHRERKNQELVAQVTKDVTERVMAQIPLFETRSGNDFQAVARQG